MVLMHIFVLYADVSPFLEVQNVLPLNLPATVCCSPHTRLCLHTTTGQQRHPCHETASAWQPCWVCSQPLGLPIPRTCRHVILGTCI